MQYVSDSGAEMWLVPQLLVGQAAALLWGMAR